jgi:hypothetical protein
MDEVQPAGVAAPMQPSVAGDGGSDGGSDGGGYDDDDYGGAISFRYAGPPSTAICFRVQSRWAST